MSLIPMQYDGGGYEDVSVTITANSSATHTFQFNATGRATGFAFVQSDDLYYLINESSGLQFAVVNNANVQLQIKGSHPNTRTITIRRYYI